MRVCGDTPIMIVTIKSGIDIGADGSKSQRPVPPQRGPGAADCYLSNDRGSGGRVALATPVFAGKELAEHFPDAVRWSCIPGKLKLHHGLLELRRVVGTLIERAVEPRIARLVGEIGVPPE